MHCFNTSSLRRTLGGALLGVIAFGPLMASALAEVPPIERIVPRDTVMFIGVRDLAASWKRIQATPMGGFFQSDAVQELLREMRDDSGYRELLEQSEVESLEELLPEGGAGAALFLEMDEDLGIRVPAFLIIADYGDRAERFARLYRDGLERDAAEGGPRPEEREVRGRTVVSIEIPVTEVEEEDVDDEFDDFDAFGGLGMDPSLLFGSLRTIHVVRDAERLLMSSSLLALEDALGVVDGEPLANSLADNAEFQDVVTQLGGAKDAYGALLTTTLQQMLGAVAGMQISMAQPYIAQLFGDIRAYSVGLEIGEGEAMMTQTIGMLIPRGRAGLLTLVDGAAPRGPVPAFVGPDAIGYGTISLRLERLMPLVNTFVQSLPPMAGDMAVPMLEQFGPALEQAFGGFGPDAHTISFAPANPGEPGQTVFAIRCTRIEAANSLVAMFGPGVGLMPRDFLGQTIYASDDAPVAVGLGGGWMVVGAVEGVERILRSVGQADLPTIADEPVFRQAVAAIPAGELLSWGYSDTVGAVRAMPAMGAGFLQGLMEEGDVPEELAGMSDVFERLLDPELIAKHFGPQAWAFESRDSGLVFRSMLLRPTAAD